MAVPLIYTSVLVDAERDLRVLERLPQEARHSISGITASERLHGVHRAAPDHVRIRCQVIVEALAHGARACHGQRRRVQARASPRTPND